MKAYKYILLVLLVLAIAGGIYGYLEYNRTSKDLMHVKADINVTAVDLCSQFSNDEKAASSMYIGVTPKEKVLAVKGKITSIDNENGLNSVLLGTDVDMSSVSCQMDSVYNADATQLKVGEEVVMKGICTGFLTDVILIRCVIQK